MDLATSLTFWMLAAIVTAALAIAALGVLVYLGWLDEREDRRLGLSPRQQQASKHGKAVRS